MFTETLAEFAVATKTSEIPDAAIDAARYGTIDTLGCALAGASEPVSGIAANWVRENAVPAGVTVWGHGLTTSAANAAFVNGISSHALDFDDSHPSVRGHASASLVPSVLAVGETAGASGLEVLAAYAIGVEIAGKIGRAYGHGLVRGGWHPTAVVGMLASTAAVARLSGQDAVTLQTAWGIVGSEIGGLVRNFGTMTKPFHVGRAARSAVSAVFVGRSRHDR